MDYPPCEQNSFEPCIDYSCHMYIPATENNSHTEYIDITEPYDPTDLYHIIDRTKKKYKSKLEQLKESLSKLQLEITKVQDTLVPPEPEKKVEPITKTDDLAELYSRIRDGLDNEIVIRYDKLCLKAKIYQENDEYRFLVDQEVKFEKEIFAINNKLKKLNELL